MISAASELLRAFIASEARKLDGVPMPHMPTLGKAYEAIAKAGIDQRFVLPPHLDLRVVSGFIQGSSKQYDCMLVQGAGERYGLTDEYRYPIDQVLCVFEVKKRLTKSELADAIDHLAEVQKCFLDSFLRRYADEKFASIRGAVRAFERMSGRIGPGSSRALDGMALQDRTLIGWLTRQRYAPVTVLFGFDGYETESGLRGALLKIMAGEVGRTTNTSIDLLPTLVTSGDYSIVKCNAQPYMVQRHEGGWVAAASTRHNSALILLELLWTKISSFCDVRMPFGDDNQMETLKELFALCAVPHGDAFAWQVNSFEYSETQLQRPESLFWTPGKVGRAGVFLINRLALQGGALPLDGGVASYIQSAYGVSMETVLSDLVETNAFARSSSYLQVTSDATFLATLDDGTGYVAVERDKLERWCEEHRLKVTFLTRELLVPPSVRRWTGPSIFRSPERETRSPEAQEELPICRC